LPLTGKSVVDLLITELAVFEFNKQSKEMLLIEIASNTTLEEVKKNTGARFNVSPNLKTF
jgi:acyl CoA:acetate/3-ketoacid CoA transferase beta subunit